MFRLWWLILPLILVPAMELWGIIKVGGWIGVGPTILLIILTGVAGAWLAKREGLKTWQQFQRDLAYGRVPGRTIFEGMAIFAGGLLLLTPGFFTDITGFLLVFPATRPIIVGFIYRWLRDKIQFGHFRFFR
jgi:UPF0716 protein FxsA